MTDACRAGEGKGPAAAPLHGGRRQEAARRLKIPKEELLDFSASINMLGPPPGAVRAMKNALAETAYYPEEDGSGLARPVAGFLGVEPRQVALGNGSIELIYWLAALLAPEQVLIIDPTFSEYRRACEAAGARCDSLCAGAADGFIPDLGAVVPGGYDLVFVCNPNNPTGAQLEVDEILHLWERCRTAGAGLVVDEAFVEFAGPGSSVLGRGVREGLYVLRSFTKSFALAGLRAGALAADERLVAALKRRMPPWNVNSVARAAVEASLTDEYYLDRTREVTARERARLFEDLEGIDGVAPLPSAANFILFRVEAMSAAELARRLALEGILVRDCRSFPGLGDSYLRVAVREDRENRQLLAALRRLLDVRGAAGRSAGAATAGSLDDEKIYDR